MTKQELLEARAQFVKQYVENGNKRGIKTSFSVRALSEKVLFVTERTIYDDLAKARTERSDQVDHSQGSRY